MLSITTVNNTDNQNDFFKDHVTLIYYYTIIIENSQFYNYNFKL